MVVDECSVSGISIHVPLRGTTHRSDGVCPVQDFNPHTSARYDRVDPGCKPFILYFNPRTSARYDSGSLFPTSPRRYFNPRTSARYDGSEGFERVDDAISIHVPLRGTTRRKSGSDHCSRFQSTYLYEVRRITVKLSYCDVISIHVPLRGTTFSDSVPKSRGDFNPRTSARYDRLRVCRWGCNGISIHVPLRGTTQGKNPTSPERNFNPRTSARYDPTIANRYSIYLFQSTYLCEVRLTFLIQF